MIKRGWVIPSIFLLTIPLVRADIMQTIQNVWTKILWGGNLGFLTGADATASITRILLWLLMFTVFFGVFTTFNSTFSFLSRGQAGVVAGVIATISAIFLPQQVLLATGAGWATVISLLLIGGPVVGVAYLMYRFPEDGDTKGTVAIKFAVCLLLLWVLSVMKHHIGTVV